MKINALVSHRSPTCDMEGSANAPLTTSAFILGPDSGLCRNKQSISLGIHFTVFENKQEYWQDSKTVITRGCPRVL